MTELIVSIIAVVLLTVANWKIFTKSGNPGWYSLIPFYNFYKLYQICWKGSMGITVMILTFGMGLASYYTDDLLILAVPAAISILIQLVFCGKLAKAYGKGFLTAIALAFAPFIGRMIIGFSKKGYVGKTA